MDYDARDVQEYAKQHPEESDEEILLMDDSDPLEPKTKAPRTTPSSSPSSKGLFAPYFAGNVVAEEDEDFAVDDEMWENEVLDYMEDSLFPDGDEEEFLYESKPPNLRGD